MTRKVDKLRTDKSILVKMEETWLVSNDHIKLNLSTFFPVNAQRLILFPNFSLVFTLNCANFFGLFHINFSMDGTKEEMKGNSIKIEKDCNKNRGGFKINSINILARR